MPKPKDFICKKCQKSFGSWEELEAHYYVQHPEAVGQIPPDVRGSMDDLMFPDEMIFERGTKQ